MRTRQQKKAGSHMLADRRTRVDIKKALSNLVVDRRTRVDIKKAGIHSTWWLTEELE